MLEFLRVDPPVPDFIPEKSSSLVIGEDRPHLGRRPDHSRLGRTLAGIRQRYMDRSECAN